MADYFIEGDSLAAIADAIREPLGEVDIIFPGDMADKIHNDLGNVRTIIERTATEVMNGNVESVGDYAFYSHPTLVTVSFPRCIAIGEYAFTSCTSLTTAYFPTCSSVGNSAFAGCTNIQNATIGTSEITSTAFPFKSASSVLGNLDLFNCKNIGASAFYNYKKLSSVYLAAESVITLANVNAFTNTPMSNSTYLSAFGSIYVPESLVTAYKTANNWSKYADRITYIA